MPGQRSAEHGRAAFSVFKMTMCLLKLCDTVYEQEMR